MKKILLSFFIGIMLIACSQKTVSVREVWTKEQANEWYKQWGWLRGCDFIPSTAINQMEMWQADTFDPVTIDRGMSVSWFIRNFKKYTGSTPMQFIVGIRINNAQMLLETTTYSINEISKIVGYDNQLYFSRLFHKLKGYSPREYRKIRNKF